MDDAPTGESYSESLYFNPQKNTPAASKKTIATKRKELLRHVTPKVIRETSALNFANFLAVSIIEDDSIFLKANLLMEDKR